MISLTALTTLHTEAALFLIRLAFFLAVTVTMWQGIRMEMGVVTGNARTTQSATGGLTEVLVGFMMVVLAPLMLDTLGAMVLVHSAPTGITLTGGAGSAGEIATASFAGADALSSLTHMLYYVVLPLSLFICNLTLMALGCMVMVSSTTGNVVVQGTAWVATMVVLASSMVVIITPLMVMGVIAAISAVIGQLGIP
ncbi:MAG: hypothetical protein ACYDAG_04295 [Chloroflexota bacterium]